MPEEMYTMGIGRRSPTYRELGSLSPRSSSMEEDAPLHHHFLDECFLCKQHLGKNGDIYMYKGNTPFCSEECREEQIELDEMRERTKSAFRASARKERQRIKAKAKAAGAAAAAAAKSISVRAGSDVGVV